MNKKYPWKRFLSSVLACGMLLGCFTGCDAKNGEIETIKYSTLGNNPGPITTNPLPSGVTLPDDVVTPDVPSPTPITLTVWGPTEDIGEGRWLTTQLKAFEKAYKDEYDVTWEVGVCYEGDAQTMVTSDPEAAADVYMFSSDQLGALIHAGGLAQLGGANLEQVKNSNYGWAIDSVTYTDGCIYGYPVSSQTWFMYYNKSMISAEEAKSLEAMLAKTQVAFDWGNGWYNGSFFFGAGGTLFGPNGLDADAGVDYKGETGGAVAKRMVELYNAGMIDGGNGADLALFMEGRVGAFFSGSWSYAPLKKTLGDALGIAVLPSFTVGGMSYNMKSFSGTKCVGVNAHIDSPTVAKAANELAAFLSSEESQELRFALRGVTPTNKNVINSHAVQNHPVCSVELEVMSNYSIMQPGIPAMGRYWSPMGTFGGSIPSGAINEDNVADYLLQTLAQING